MIILPSKPMDVPEVGRQLRQEVMSTLRRFCVLPSDAHYEAVTQWIMVTHCLSAFDIAPRLVIRSVEKRSGKTRLLEVVRQLTANPMATSNMTEAVLFRTLAGGEPRTILIDEADTIFGERVADSKEALRGVINAGFSKGASVHRVAGPNHDVVEFPVFGMVALAGIGRMPDTIEDRAVVVEMKRRRAETEVVDDYRVSRDGEALVLLSERLHDWSEAAVTQLEGADPTMPVVDRAADTWYPLVAVADLIGADVGDLVRRACAELVADAESAGESQSSNIQLLTDISRIFRGTERDFIGSTILCTLLTELEDSPWGDWGFTPSRLAHRLKSFGVQPRQDSTRTKRGYYKSDLAEVFGRYLPDLDALDASGHPEGPEGPEYG